MTILLCHRCQVPVTVPHYVTAGDGNCLCVSCVQARFSEMEKYLSTDRTWQHRLSPPPNWSIVVD